MASHFWQPVCHFLLPTSMEVSSIKQTSNLPGFLIAFLGAILFSTKAVIVKKAFHDVHIDALTLLTMRMLFSLPFYMVTAFYSSGQKHPKLSRREWGMIILLGLFGYYLSSLFDFIGLQYISDILMFVIILLSIGQASIKHRKSVWRWKLMGVHPQ